MQETELYKRIRKAIEDIPLVDTHEHLVSEKIQLSQDIDLFNWFSHYVTSDIISAGMPESTVVELLADKTMGLDQRWAKIAPFWSHVQTTAYGRALLIAARDLYGISEINDSTYAELSKITASNQKGWYQQVLKERGNIEISIVQLGDEAEITEIDNTLFVAAISLDDFIQVRHRRDLKRLEQRSGLSIHSLDELLRAVATLVEKAANAGAVGIKTELAYVRILYYEKVAKADAERVFNEIVRYPRHGRMGMPSQPPFSWDDAKVMQDYIMHQLICYAIDYKLPIQVHTGIQNGNSNIITNSNPVHLANLFIEYPEARFDVFHAGYPYQSETATLAKNFANVYPDMCWLHLISPWVARQTLHEWIETVPANKILGFGGDEGFVEGAYAHSRMARDNVAEVLTEKVIANYLTESEAADLARRILRDNAKELFKLKD